MKTANRKQQNTDNVLLLVENCDIKLEILNELAHLNQSQTQITVMSELFSSEGFSLGHVTITTIIMNPDHPWKSGSELELITLESVESCF